MTNERKPDLGGPDYEAVEAHVKDIMDPDTPDSSVPAEKKSVGKKKSTKKASPQLSPGPREVRLSELSKSGKKISVAEESQPPIIAHEQEVKKLKITYDGPESSEDSVVLKPRPQKVIEPPVQASRETEKETIAEKGAQQARRKITIVDSNAGEDNLVAVTEEAAPDSQGEQISDQSTDVPTAPVILELVEPHHRDEEAPIATSLNADKLSNKTPETFHNVTPEINKSPEDEISDPIEDTETDAIVDEIILAEKSKYTDDSEEPLIPSSKTLDKRKKAGGKFSPLRIVRTWWHREVLRWVTFVLFFGAIIISGAVPTSRYYLLNLAGVRSSASMTVIDDSTQMPLKNVTVTLQGSSGATDSNGRVVLKNIRLGSADLKIAKRAFAPFNKKIVVGWGSNPLGEYRLTPTGTQYKFTVNDFLSGKPVPNVEASYGDATSVADAQGIIKLTLEKDIAELDTIDIKLTADGYRTELVKIKTDITENQDVKLVTARKHVYVSKRSGKYDIYAIDADGKNEKMILAGTGNERDDLVLIPHPEDEIAALVSTRENKRNKDGFLLNSLTLLNLSDNTSTQIAQSERVQILDWIGPRLVYVEVVAGASAANPNRQRLQSYDYKAESKKELAASNYFNDIKIAGGMVYYAPSSMYTQSQKSDLFRVSADGSKSMRLLNTETWNIFRVSYDRLILAPQQEWYELKLGETKPLKLSGQPASLDHKVFIDSPDGKMSLWLENRDGKGVLLSYDIASKQEKTVKSMSGLSYPVRWLSNRVIVYRISTPQETADYVMSLDGGDALKLRDVTNTGGIDNWYYY